MPINRPKVNLNLLAPNPSVLDQQYQNITRFLESEAEQRYQQKQLDKQAISETPIVINSKGEQQEILPQVKGMSGADPIGQLVVEVAAGDPLFKYAGKAGSYVLGKTGIPQATRQLIARGKNAVQRFKAAKTHQLVGHGTISRSDPRISLYGQSDLYPDFSKMTRAEKIQYLNTQKELAQRVDQARNLDALRMTKDRLKSGGLKRLQHSVATDILNLNTDVLTKGLEAIPLSKKQEYEIIDMVMNNQNRILRAQPTRGTAQQVAQKVNSHTDSRAGGEGAFNEWFAWYKDAPLIVRGLSKGNKGAAHEFTHYFYWPLRRPKGFDPKSGTIREYRYFTNPTSQEIAARGTQLKNYYGLKEREQLTPEMYKYAARHYASDVADNTMTQFFKFGNSKFPNHSLFLHWLNRNAPAIAGLTTGGLTLNTLNNGFN